MPKSIKSINFIKRIRIKTENSEIRNWSKSEFMRKYMYISGIFILRSKLAKRKRYKCNSCIELSSLGFNSNTQRKNQIILFLEKTRLNYENLNIFCMKNTFNLIQILLFSRFIDEASLFHFMQKGFTKKNYLCKLSKIKTNFNSS